MHLGKGRCAEHGGKAGEVLITHGLYSQILINHPRIQALKEKYLALPDPLSSEHELALQRALLHDYLERFDESQQALMAWYETQGKEPPANVLSIESAYKIVESVTRIIERAEKVRAANAVSRTDLLRTLGNMARIVELYVKDERTLEKIRDGWRDIHV